MITATVIAIIVLPLIVLRGRTLLAFYGTAAGIALFAWIVWRRVPDFDPYLGFVAAAVIEFAVFFLFLACGRNVAWSAGRAGVVAAVIYALTIPAMLRTPIDGDEPFYLLITESIVRDADLDLANQYRALELSRGGRLDLVPQFGDPTGPNGEQYSRHEPFLSILMVPGYMAGGLYGVLATIALFGALLVRSTIRWMEDEGVADAAARAVFPLFAFGPPVLFYATRIWPEVPAAFFFVETLRGIRHHRAKRWIPALLGLVLLKLRFVLVAVGVVVVLCEYRRLPAGPGGAENRAGWKPAVLVGILAILAIPMLVAFLVTGSATNVHDWREIIPTSPMKYVIGLAGLVADGAGGIAFQAPFYLLGLFAVTRWRTTPRGFRDGLIAGILYVFYLLPRPEWWGGWAPPLRYLVFLMPVLALGAAAMWDRISRGAIAVISVVTVGLVIHGLTYPWRLFHATYVENAAAEWLSRMYEADFSRLLPSFIRPNGAAWIGLMVVIAIVVAGVRRYRVDLTIPVVTLALAAGFTEARRPGARVEFEDAHVVHKGGRIVPDVFTMLRVFHRSGWVLEAGDSATFLARRGTHTLHYITGRGALIEVAGRAYHLPPGQTYTTAKIEIPAAGRVTLRVDDGAINVDRMDRDE
jgi:hypothetical protein